MNLEKRIEKWQKEVEQYADRQKIFPWPRVFEANQLINELLDKIESQDSEIHSLCAQLSYDSESYYE